MRTAVAPGLTIPNVSRPRKPSAMTVAIAARGISAQHHIRPSIVVGSTRPSRVCMTTAGTPIESTPGRIVSRQRRRNA